MQQPKTIKIFLASSITELQEERVLFGDYIMNSIRPIFQADGIETELIKCEDIHSGNTGVSSQKEIDDRLRSCNISVFLFKTKAGVKTQHEFDVAQKLQDEKRHEIYVYCFDVSEDQKSEELKAFQLRLEKEEIYWKTINVLDNLKSEFILGLLKYERSLLGMKPLNVNTLETENVKDGESRLALYKETEAKQSKLREQIHQDIENLLQQQNKIIMDDEDTIAGKIARTIELYKKADHWATITDYDKKKHSDLLYDYAFFLDDFGLYTEAEVIYLRQIQIAEELYGTEDVVLANSYNNIGLVYLKSGEYDKALEYHLKALAMRENAFSKMDPSIATSYNNIGLVYFKKGNYKKALDYHFKSLAIREVRYGKDHTSTAKSYTNIGLVYQALKDYDKALEFFYKDLVITEKVGTQSDIATSYNNYGGVCYIKEDYDRALEYYLKAKAIWEKVLGEYHPDTATSYDNIGLVYLYRNKKGDDSRASEFLFKALEIREEALGKEHPDTATSYKSIGCLYFYQGDFFRALEYLSKAYQIFHKALGPEHPNTKEALEWFERVKNAM